MSDVDTFLTNTGRRGGVAALPVALNPNGEPVEANPNGSLTVRGCLAPHTAAAVTAGKTVYLSTGCKRFWIEPVGGAAGAIIYIAYGADSTWGSAAEVFADLETPANQALAAIPLGVGTERTGILPVICQGATQPTMPPLVVSYDGLNLINGFVFINNNGASDILLHLFTVI